MSGLDERCSCKRRRPGDERSTRCKRRRVAMESASASAASKFMSLARDDVLIEILLRLPHARFVIQARSVCKRWLSLLSEPYFIRRFIQIHGFNYAHSTMFVPSNCGYEREYHLFPPKSNNLHGGVGVGVGSGSGDYLNFFPKTVAIKASCQDLVLVSPSYQNYSICNPLTRQRVALPEAPQGGYERCGILCEPNHNNSHQFQFRYKVLVIVDFFTTHFEYVFDAAVFCSETGKWSRSTLSCPRTSAPKFDIWNEFVASSSTGILYSLLSGAEDDDIKGFAAFDLSDGGVRFRFFDLPVDFDRGCQACLDHVCSGVVRGRLRLSQLVKTNQEFVLKVWELNHNNNNNKNKGQEWLLVHKVRLQTEETERLFVAAFHPYNEDVIYMFCDHDVYKYKIGQGEFKIFGRLPDQYPKSIADELMLYLRSYTLVYPSWPTSIPTLPDN